MRKAKSGKKETSQLVAICVGVLTSTLITLFLSAIAGIFIQNEYLEIQSVTVISIIVQGISVLLGALIAGILTPSTKFISCILIGSIYYFILAGSAILFFEGISSSAIISFIVCFAATFLAIMHCTKGNQHIPSTKKRKRNR